MYNNIYIILSNVTAIAIKFILFTIWIEFITRYTILLTFLFEFT